MIKSWVYLTKSSTTMRRCVWDQNLERTQQSQQNRRGDESSGTQKEMTMTTTTTTMKIVALAQKLLFIFILLCMNHPCYCYFAVLPTSSFSWTSPVSVAHVWTTTATAAALRKRRRLLTTRHGSHDSEFQERASDDNDDKNENQCNSARSFVYNAEVVGASGRMGSFWLVTPLFDSIAVPRGCSPGYLTPPGSPIFVNTPGGGTIWKQIYQQTPFHRRSDLVFVGNGIISLPINDCGCTFVVPHYAILEHCRRHHCQDDGKKSSSQPSWILTSPKSPPTYIYGPHAHSTSKALQDQGVRTEIVDSLTNIQIVAARKLLWASCFWLLCHYDIPVDENVDIDKCQYGSNTHTNKTNVIPPPPSPRMVQQVHDHPVTQSLLEELVDELLPAVMALVLPTTAKEATVLETHNNSTCLTLLSRENILDYLLAYSRSIPNAIPSKELALSELEQRNGVWVQSQQQTQLQQPLHQKLVGSVAGHEAWQQLINRAAEESTNADSRNSRDGPSSNVTTNGSQIASLLEIPEVQLAVWGVKDKRMTACLPQSGENNDMTENELSQQRSVIVIGSGILGSSVALYLSRYSDISVIVVEKHTNHSTSPSPSSQTRPSKHLGSRPLNPENHPRLTHRALGTTTPASWAWLNANQKRPQSYQWLNQLGLHVWKQEPILQSLPLWNGSLVRYDASHGETSRTLLGNCLPICVQEGGYAACGPLSREQVSILEPYANFTSVTAAITMDPTIVSTDKETTKGNQTDTGIYFFPDEGCVDPAVAVHALQQEARRLGATFLFDHKVIRFLDDDDENTPTGSPKGVECQIGSGNSTSSTETVILYADTIVVAAGIGMDNLGGGIPSLLSLDPPGQIVHVAKDQNNDGSSSSSSNDTIQSKRLTRILVDMVQSSHVLQRRDGTIVVGGGTLVVGGTACPAGTTAPSSSSTRTKEEGNDDSIHLQEEQQNAEALLQRAALLAPGMFRGDTTPRTDSQFDTELVNHHWDTAIRPMPLDGLPIMGYHNRRASSSSSTSNQGGGGLYLLVTHSGMTLGPFLGCMAAGEIAQQISLEVLGPYRPGRFMQNTTGNPR